jgi:hypothetical protein
MDLLVLLVVLLFGLLSVLIRRSSQRAPAPPPASVRTITDPAVAHRALVENADAFSDRPVLPFFVHLAKRRGSQRKEHISTVP